MVNVYIQSFVNNKWLQLQTTNNGPLKYNDVLDQFCQWQKISCSSLRVFQGCKEICENEDVAGQDADIFLTTSIPLCGGKGGFGSMLRAIGAQIEKTTNREACRDLSGRRLRDINEEKRLKNWVEKQAEREKEAEDRKRKKLEKLKFEYKHEFSDPDYDKARSEVSEKVHDAVAHGMQVASTLEPSSSKKRKIETSAMKKTLWTGISDEDLDSDDLDSEEEKAVSENVEETNNAATTEGTSRGEASEEPSREETVEETSNNSVEPKSHGPSAENNGKTVSDEVTPAETPQPVEEETNKSQDAEEIKNAKPLETKETQVDPSLDAPIVLEDYDSAESLESLGLEKLKKELQNRGLKCGGTIKERAARLFSVKNLKPEEIDPSLLSKPPKQQKK